MFCMNIAFHVKHNFVQNFEINQPTNLEMQRIFTAIQINNYYIDKMVMFIFLAELGVQIRN